MSRQKPHSRRLDLANGVEWDHPLNKGRVAWWLGADGAGGRLTDLCHVASLDGSLQPLTGGPAWTTPRNGAFKELTLNGANYVTFGTSLPALDFGTNPYSFGGWITVPSGAPTSTFPFCRRSPSAAGNPGYEFLYSSAGVMTVRANGGSIAWSGGINDGVRRRYICTVNPGGNTVLYVNGRPVTSGSTGTSSSSVTDGTATQIGARNGALIFTGSVGDFSIWGRLLAPAEVALEFDHASRGYTGPDSPIRWQRGRAWSYGIIFPPITATLSVTQAGDTLSASGAVAIGASLTVTQANNTESAAAAAAVTASVSQTQADQSASSAGAVLVSATAAISQAHQVVAGAGVVLIGGVLVATQAADTLAAAGTVVTPPPPIAHGRWLIQPGWRRWNAVPGWRRWLVRV